MKGEVEYKGKLYKNIRQLAKEIGMDPGTLYGRINKGLSIEEAVNEPISKKNNPKEVYCYGERFESISELARSYGIDAETISRRLAKGIRPEEAVLLEKRESKNVQEKVEFEGKEYKNLSVLAKEMGVPYGLVYRVKDSAEEMRKVIDKYGKENTERVVCFGVEYANLKELLEQYGISKQLYKNRIKMGWSVEDAVAMPVQENRIKPVEYRGKQYSSISELAREVGSHPVVLARKIREGMSVEEAVEGKPVELVECEGKTYKGLKGVAEAYGVGLVTLKKRLDKGMKIEDAVHYSDVVNRVVEFRGKVYGSITQVAKEVGMSPVTLNARVRSGMSLEEAVSCYVNIHYKPIVYKGVYYENISDLARAYGMRPASLIARMNRGMTLEEAMEIPMIPKPKRKRKE